MSDFTQNADATAGALEPLQVGQVVGSFRVVRKLGEGGMGTVFAAEHQHIGYKAAIKVLHQEYSRHPEIARRFLNEARAVNIIQHPGVVKIFEYGRLRDGSAYIIMEYLEGETLNRRLERAGGRIRPTDAVRLGRQIASALSAAHARNVVHRDLKPANIILVPDPEAAGRERAKILDFGLAKVVDPISAESPGLGTRTGVVLGTAMYMAPEQCRGARDVDGRADVYALGILIFEMCSGRPPFVSESEGELVTMQLRDPPPPLRMLEPAVPPDLAALVHRLLAKDPADRPDMPLVTEELEKMGAMRDSAPLSMPLLQTQEMPSVPPPPPSLPSGKGRADLPAQDSTPRPSKRRMILFAALGAAAGMFLALGVAFHFRDSGAASSGSWSTVPTETTYHLRALWHDGAGSYWTVGDSGTILHGKDGHWSVVPSGTTQSLRGVWGVHAADVWTVGGGGTVLRWNGRAWAPVASPKAANLRGVWASGSADAWAVGEQGVIVHWDGERWAAVPSGVSEDFRAVWGSTTKDVWAVGEYGLLVHWDGTRWVKETTDTRERLAKVWGLSTVHVWAVGNEGTILHYDGKKWTRQSAPTNQELSAVYGSSPDDVWVVGNNGTILRYRNGSWHSLNPKVPRHWLYGISGGMGEEELWVVGAHGTLLRHRR